MMKSFNELAADLAKPGADIVAEMTPQKAHLLHMAVGVAGEAMELFAAATLEDFHNFIEEAGDICFFLAGLENGIGGLKVESPKPLPKMYGRMSPTTRVLIKSEKILDKVKKHVIYNEDLDERELAIVIDDIRRILEYVVTASKATMEDVLVANNAKLSKRYATGSYSNAQAQERADKGPQMTGSDLKTARN